MGVNFPVSRSILAKRILREEAEKSGCNIDDVLSDKRSYAFCMVRHIAMWRAYYELKLNYSQIGRAFNRDHSTVLYGVKRINRLGYGGG